jgi:hypothetical protein
LWVGHAIEFMPARSCGGRSAECCWSYARPPGPLRRTLCCAAQGRWCFPIQPLTGFPPTMRRLRTSEELQGHSSRLVLARRAIMRHAATSPMWGPTRRYDKALLPPTPRGRRPARRAGAITSIAARTAGRLDNSVTSPIGQDRQYLLAPMPWQRSRQPDLSRSVGFGNLGLGSGPADEQLSEGSPE